MGDLVNMASEFLSEREKQLVEQIYSNMVGRGIVDGEDEGFESSELYILAYHLKQIHLEQLSNVLYQMAQTDYYLVVDDDGKIIKLADSREEHVNPGPAPVSKVRNIEVLE